ncbi:MAG: hypothetical protein QT08_C0009G0088 [archaeon GW2011_AR17]|nr:MAG: hypothetical protein QT08_C0009G0088 [archaeon GW2011_AR17]MBS3154120.1 hypothetical protein [Candidatus Woesearchaeota archaeon]HIH14715.1 hypothetical protein [Nanoarchaeota archaeon]HIH59006.1 hypothetical protein [Nanoarchaeota archaeon]HII14394.1 hypothetical protein [Nanoarchaeota archaeon]
MKDKLLGVKILSILNYVGAGMYLLFALLLLFVAVGYNSLENSGELEASFTAEELAQLQSFGDLTTFFYIAAVICLALAVLAFFLGRAFWKGQNWGRVVTLALSALGIVFSLVSLVSAFIDIDSMTIFVSLIQIIINTVIIWYLLRADVIKYFTSKKKN